MKKINQPYVITNSHSFPMKRHHVVQSFDMRLVASTHMFLATPAGEYMRRSFLHTTASPYHWAKVPGLRVYVKLEGSMRRILPDEEEDRKEDIHATLQEMAAFYAEHGLTEGQRRQYADREVPYNEREHTDRIPYDPTNDGHSAE